MGLINERELLNKENTYQEKVINEMGGVNNYISKFRNLYFNNNIFVNDIISKSFENFNKDLKRFITLNKNNKGMDIDIEDSQLSLQIINKSDLIIFEVPEDKDKVDYKLNNSILPFDNFFISTYLPFFLDNEIVTVNGILITNLFKELGVRVYFIISNTINDGWGIKSFYLSWNNILKNDYDFLQMNDIKLNNPTNPFRSELRNEYMIRVKNVIQKLMYLLETKQYSSYKYLTKEGVIDKEIVDYHKVRSHKRHFWFETKRWKVNKLDNEILINKGYGIDPIVYKDLEVKYNVPFKVIDSFSIGQKKADKKFNKVKSFIDKNNFRNEIKLGQIIKDIFPNEIIRHNKCFTKNSNLRLDYNVWDRRIAFEYDGEQHFNKELYENIYGEGFDEQVKRDKIKENLCKKKNIKLIRIKFNDPLTKRYIKKRLKQIGVECK